MAKLHFYYSAMNAGKTTTLLQSDYNYRERGMDTLLFISKVVKREHEVGVIKSRIGLKTKAIPFDKSFDFFSYVQEKLYNNPNIKCILIDEAQFLSKDQVYQLTRICDVLNRPVLAYGLRSDFIGEPFEGSKYLLILAEELIEIKTICHCGSKATMNARIDEKGRQIRHGDQIAIGGNEKYVTLCRKHFQEGNLGLKIKSLTQ